MRPGVENQAGHPDRIAEVRSTQHPHDADDNHGEETPDESGTLARSQSLQPVRVPPASDVVDGQREYHVGPYCVSDVTRGPEHR